jgi:ABC-2 type transport system permease protein
MRNTWLIARYEIISTLNRKSFLLVSIFIPLFFAFLFTFTLDSGDDSSDGGTEVETIDTEETLSEGLVDRSGLVTALPEDLPSGNFTLFPDETAAQAAVDAGEIDAYYIIPDDYLETGEIINVREDYNPFSSDDRSGWVKWTLAVNLLGGDAQLADQVWRPVLDMDVQEVGPKPDTDVEEDCTTPGQNCESNEFVSYLPMIITLIIYMMILLPSGQLLGAMAKEKENRVIEILMSSISPWQMLTGKVLGLGIIGLMEGILWGGVGYMTLMSGRIDLPEGFTFPIEILVWFFVFLLLGYTFYASLMVGAGAMLSAEKEATGAAWLIIWPLIIPITPLPEILDDAVLNGWASQVLGFLPPTAPIEMMKRVSDNSVNVPLWEPVLSAAIMVVATVFIVRISARMIHAQNMLSGQPFSAGRFVRQFLGRV